MGWVKSFFPVTTHDISDTNDVVSDTACTKNKFQSLTKYVTDELSVKYDL